MPDMAGPFFREWRKKRGYTLEELAGRLALFDDPQIPKTAASLSRLENGIQPYGQPIIDALAAVYEIEPFELIGINPAARDDLGAAMGMLGKMDEVSRRRTLKLIELKLIEAMEDQAASESDPAPKGPQSKRRSRKKAAG
jgi:transcriptional regulator with XRE-family HTH domain